MYESQSLVPEAADIERESTFQLAIDIDEQLSAMNLTLKETVETLNSVHSASNTASNPVSYSTFIHVF